MSTMLENNITIENLTTLVNHFYTKVLKDETVGPFFIEKLGPDMNSGLWKPHLTLIRDFWASIALGDTAYKGTPFAPHLQIEGIHADAFSQWLVLFFETLDNLYEPKIANLFKERATIIAGNFMRNLGLSS